MIISTMAWSWPQWAAVAMMAFTFISHAFFHGTARSDYNVGWTVLDMALWTLVLIAGGFFA